MLVFLVHTKRSGSVCWMNKWMNAQMQLKKIQKIEELFYVHQVSPSFKMSLFLIVIIVAIADIYWAFLCSRPMLNPWYTLCLFFFLYKIQKIFETSGKLLNFEYRFLHLRNEDNSTYFATFWERLEIIF